MKLQNIATNELIDELKKRGLDVYNPKLPFRYEPNHIPKKRIKVNWN